MKKFILGFIRLNQTVGAGLRRSFVAPICILPVSRKIVARCRDLLVGRDSWRAAEAARECSLTPFPAREDARPTFWLRLRCAALYRRFAIGRASGNLKRSEWSDACRIQFSDTADCKSALRALVVALLFAGCLSARAQPEWLDKLDDSLFVQSPNGWFRTDLSGLLDLEAYYIDQPPMGLLFSDEDYLINPRLSLFLDTRLGSQLYSLVQFRFDRGFDPGVFPNGDLRFDEYFIRYTAFDDSRLNLQFGKFATVVGNWVPRHLSWNNPFINAPLPYENVVAITDHTAPAGSAAFLARRNKPDMKGMWVPVIWGPSYATGGSIFGRVEKFEYAVEFKNVALSSRPYAWDATHHAWDYPVVSGRLGIRPNAAWNIGSSFSYGAYMLPPEDRLAPGGPIKGHFKQITVGTDVSYAWRHWLIWAEAFASRFEVPIIGDADTIAYYVETKYELTPRLFGALRWNQQLFDEISDGLGGRARWDRDIWRIDTALGYRFSRHLQAKLQYSLSQQNGPRIQGEQMVGGQLTLKF